MANGKGKKGGGGVDKGGGGLSWMKTDKLEAEIERVGARIREIDAQLHREEVYRDRDKCTALLEERAGAQQEQERLEAEWLKRVESA